METKTDRKVTVYITSDYGRFQKFKRRNRGKGRDYIKRVTQEAPPACYINLPILVNEEMEVVEGWDRLEALEMMKSPFLISSSRTTRKKAKSKKVMF